jgi:hypothetical protein
MRLRAIPKLQRMKGEKTEVMIWIALIKTILRGAGEGQGSDFQAICEIS